MPSFGLSGPFLRIAPWFAVSSLLSVPSVLLMARTLTQDRGLLCPERNRSPLLHVRTQGFEAVGFVFCIFKALSFYRVEVELLYLNN